MHEDSKISTSAGSSLEDAEFSVSVGKFKERLTGNLSMCLVSRSTIGGGKCVSPSTVGGGKGRGRGIVVSPAITGAASNRPGQSSNGVRVGGGGRAGPKAIPHKR